MKLTLPSLLYLETFGDKKEKKLATALLNREERERKLKIKLIKDDHKTYMREELLPRGFNIGNERWLAPKSTFKISWGDVREFLKNVLWAGFCLAIWSVLAIAILSMQ